MDYIRYIELNFVDVAQWKNLEKKEKIIEKTHILTGIGRKDECFVKDKNDWENKKILLLNLLFPYYWYHYMSKRTCYTVGSQKPTEKSQSFYLNPALYNQLNFRIFPPHFYPILVSLHSCCRPAACC